MRETILSAIARQKLVVILRGLPREKLIDTLGALADGGVQLVEITFAADGRISDADTAKSIALAAELIDSGRALETLNKLIEVSNRPEAEQ